MTYNKIHSTINTKEENKVDKTKDREVKRTAREDKRVWLDQMGDEVEKHAENGTTRTVSNSQKKITNNRQRQVAAVKNKMGEIIEDKNARLERWAKHFD